MAPTEILAEQHHRNAVRFFEAAGYSVSPPDRQPKAAEKKKHGTRSLRARFR